MLWVHVIGPGYGESVVIELPNGEVGVVDSFAAPRAAPPTLEFLRAWYPDLSKLRFAALTHPHADHCMGISQYFEAYDVEEFWVFHSFFQSASMGFFKELAAREGRDAVEEALRLPAGSTSLELLRTRAVVNGQKRTKAKRKRVDMRFLAAGKRRELCDGRVTAEFLTPSDRGIRRYVEALVAAHEKLMLDGPKLNFDWLPGDQPHNQASGALLFEYGDTQILLMADAEVELWADMIEESGACTLPKAHFIKGSHHGSANGFHPEIYESSAHENTVVVITPFNRNRHPLPSAEGIARLLPHVKEILCTNGTAACRSSGLSWESPTTRPADAIPPAWVKDCLEDPERLSLLVSGQVQRPYVPGRVEIPRTWVSDCSKRPELIQLLCEPLRNGGVVGQRPSLHDEFRVSICYNDQGKIQERYIGWGVGRIAGKVAQERRREEQDA